MRIPDLKNSTDTPLKMTTSDVTGPVFASGSPLPGLLVAAGGVAIAWLTHQVLPVVPLLTSAVILGILFGNIRLRPAVETLLAPGLVTAEKRLMRIGIVLLGLKLSLGDIAGLGWKTALVVVLIVLLSFFSILLLGKLFKLPGDEPLLIAAGFSICGASAIGAFSSVTRNGAKHAAIPVALVTLFGTLAIGVLPLLRDPLGLDSVAFGQWVGASVHDVGQVVATAQVAGPAALSVAVVVKLTRVLMLAPMVAGTGLILRRTERRRTPGSGIPEGAFGKRTSPIIPLFLTGFLIAVLIRTSAILPGSWLLAADATQTLVLAAALFGLGSNVKIQELLTAGRKAFTVGLLGWVLIAACAWVGIKVLNVA